MGLVFYIVSKSHGVYRVNYTDGLRITFSGPDYTDLSTNLRAAGITDYTDIHHSDSWFQTSIRAADLTKVLGLLIKPPTENKSLERFQMIAKTSQLTDTLDDFPNILNKAIAAAKHKEAFDKLQVPLFDLDKASDVD